jgi:hypothetical protein
VKEDHNVKSLNFLLICRSLQCRICIVLPQAKFHGLTCRMYRASLHRCQRPFLHTRVYGVVTHFPFPPLSYVYWTDRSDFCPMHGSSSSDHLRLRRSHSMPTGEAAGHDPRVTSGSRGIQSSMTGLLFRSPSKSRATYE